MANHGRLMGRTKRGATARGPVTKAKEKYQLQCPPGTKAYKHPEWGFWFCGSVAQGGPVKIPGGLRTVRRPSRRGPYSARSKCQAPCIKTKDGCWCPPENPLEDPKMRLQFGQPMRLRDYLRARSDADARPSPMTRLMSPPAARPAPVPPLPPEFPYEICVEYPSGIFRSKDPNDPVHGKHGLDTYNGVTDFYFEDVVEGGKQACIVYGGGEFVDCFPVCFELGRPQMLQPGPLTPGPRPRPTPPQMLRPGPLGSRPTPRPRPPQMLQPGPLGGTPPPPPPGNGGGPTPSIPGIPGDRPGGGGYEDPTPEDLFGDCCVEMIGPTTGILVCDNPMYDGLVVMTFGEVDNQGQMLFTNADRSWRAFLPLCEPTIEIVPDPSIPDGCCYDETTGLLYCPGSDLHGMEAEVITEAVLPTGQRIISVEVAEIGWAARIPVCITVPTPDPGDEPVRPRPTEPCPPEHCYYDMSKIYDCFPCPPGHR